MTSAAALMLRLCPRCTSYLKALRVPVLPRGAQPHMLQQPMYISSSHIRLKSDDLTAKKPRKWALHDAKMKYVGSMTEKEAKKYIKSEFKGYEFKKTAEKTEAGVLIATMREQFTIIPLKSKISDHDLQIKAKAMLRKCQQGLLVRVHVDASPQLTDEFRARLRTALTEYSDVLKMKELGDGSVELREVEETADGTGQS